MSAAPKRGIKRKRDPDELPKDSHKLFKKPAATLEEKFCRKLHHGVKEVKKAAKLAKIRELQRLLKRSKELQEKKDQVEARSVIEEQLELLKNLSHETIAIDMLLRRLQKDKHIQTFVHSNEKAKAAISNEIGSASQPHNGTKNAGLVLVEGRVSSSKSLANPVGDLVTALRELILPRKAQDAKPVEEVVETKLVFEQRGDEGWESGSIGGQSQVDDEDNDNDENSDEEIPATFSDAKIRDTDSDETDALAQKIPPGSALISSISRKYAEVPVVEMEDSAFLPTLAVGYTRGDSSASDWSGDEGADNDKIDPNPRKNRRGQRARKAIWEKKYGKNANHLKKQREEEAVERRERTKKRKGSGGQRFGKAGRGAPTQAELDERPTDSGWDKKKGGILGVKAEAPLHPSWDAAKRKKALPMVVPSTGKKIIF